MNLFHKGIVLSVFDCSRLSFNTITLKKLTKFREKFHASPPAHEQGNCLELILGSPFILQHLICIGVTDSSFGAPSDHSVLFLDLHPNVFDANKDPTSPSLCSVTSRQKAKFLKCGATINRILQDSHLISSLVMQINKTTNRDDRSKNNVRRL